MRHHGAGLRRLIRDEERVRRIGAGYREAELSSRERAILDYADKLTSRPGEMTSRDVEALRDIGLTDGEILDVCQVTAYYNYVNRLADGLGVELEDYWARLRAP